MNKNILSKKYFKLIVLCVFLAQNISFSAYGDEIQSANKTSNNKIVNTIKDIFVPEKNQIFGDTIHQVGITYFEHYGQRSLHMINLSYSRQNQLFGLKGRYNGEILYLFGRDKKQHIDYGAFAFQVIQEVIFGRPMFYITAGLGVNYFCGTKIGDMTNFNFITQLSAGHRFDNGLIIEFVYRHYTNFNFSSNNHPLNLFGASIKYTFSL